MLTLTTTLAVLLLRLLLVAVSLIYIYIYIYLFMYECVYIYIYIELFRFPSQKETPKRPPERSANLRAKLLDFRGFDSSIIFILRGEILMSVGNFPESSRQAILVGIILVGRLGVAACPDRRRPPTRARTTQWRGCWEAGRLPESLIYIYIYVYVYIYIYIYIYISLSLYIYIYIYIYIYYTPSILLLRLVLWLVLLLVLWLATNSYFNVETTSANNYPVFFCMLMLKWQSAGPGEPPRACHSVLLPLHIHLDTPNLEYYCYNMIVQYC